MGAQGVRLDHIRTSNRVKVTMSKLVRDNLYFLKAVAKTPSKRQSQMLLDTATKDQLLALTEVTMNVLHGVIPLAAPYKKQLAKHKRFIRQLGDKHVGLKQKRQSLCQRAAVVRKLLKACDKVLTTL